MIALTNTARQLELDLASASSVALDIVVAFQDIRYADQTKNVGTTLSSSNGVTDVIIAAAPTSGVLRVIKSISVCNRDNTATETARIYYDESGTESDIIQVDLVGGDQLYYEDNQGWVILNSTGSLKTALSVDHGALTGLTDDDHTQYALLLGRASSQIIRGGTAASETLTLRGTSNATTGLVAINDLGGNVTVGGGATASELRILEASGAGTNYTSFTCPNLTANVNYTLPVDDGTASQFLQSNGSGTLSWATAAGFTLGTEQASTSGSSISFTGLPSGVKMIVISLIGVSTNGTGTVQFQIGDSEGLETTSYNTQTEAHTTVTEYTGGWTIDFAIATAAIYGQLILVLEDSSDNTWTATGQFWNTLQSQRHPVGSKALSLTLDRVAMVTTDTFDAGAINIAYSS